MNGTKRIYDTDPQEFTVPSIDGPKVFDGWRIAQTEQKDKDAEYEIDRFARWWEIGIYKTESEKYVCHIAFRSVAKSTRKRLSLEHDHDMAFVGSTADEIQAFLGKYGRGTTIDDLPDPMYSLSGALDDLVAESEMGDDERDYREGVEDLQGGVPDVYNPFAYVSEIPKGISGWVDKRLLQRKKILSQWMAVAQAALNQAGMQDSAFAEKI